MRLLITIQNNIFAGIFADCRLKAPGNLFKKPGTTKRDSGQAGMTPHHIHRNPGIIINVNCKINEI